MESHALFTCGDGERRDGRQPVGPLQVAAEGERARRERGTGRKRGWFGVMPKVMPKPRGGGHACMHGYLASESGPTVVVDWHSL